MLVNGETGTGKELVARAYQHVQRPERPSSLLIWPPSPGIARSELFGHERGATGAQISRKGRFEQVNGGTLFLDEIGDTPALL